MVLQIMNLNNHISILNFGLAQALFILVFFFSHQNDAFSQCDEYTPLEVVNPGFEGPTGSGQTPGPWNTCGITPDTQPGVWGVTLPPSQGNSYVGFVYSQGGNWQEGASQQLSGAMQTGIQYDFSIDLATTSVSGSGINPNSLCSMEVWGGNAICQRSWLLWTSPMITHYNWQTYDVSFTPSQNWTHLYFICNCGEGGYILLDNITPLIPNNPNVLITSHVDGDAESCGFTIAGNVTNAIIDSVVLTGNFQGSPLSTTMSGLDWSAPITFNGADNQTITATAYYSAQQQQEICGSTQVELVINSPIADFNFNGACNGTTIQFNDASIPFGATTVTDWNWDFGDGNASILQNPTHVYSTVGTYDVTLQITDLEGCASTLTQTLDLIESPVSDFNFVVGCDGATVEFTDITVPVGANIITDWNWDFGDGNTSSVQNPIHVFSVSGTYDVTLQITDSEGCSTTLTQTLNLLASPAADFNFAVECNGTTIAFTDATVPVGASVITDWNWNFGDGNTSNVQNPIHAYSVFGTYDVTLQVTDSEGCSRTLTQTLNLTQSPVADFNFAVECDGTTIDFTDATAPFGTSILTDWSWDFGDGNTSIAQNPTHVFSASGTYDVTLQVSDSDGCSVTLTQTLNLIESPVADFNFDVECDGTNIAFTDATVPVGTSIITAWNWDFGDGNTSIVQNPTHDYAGSDTYAVVLEVIDSDGCTRTLSQNLDILESQIADFTFNETCQGGTTNFSDASSLGMGIINAWSWNFGDGNTSSAQNPNNTYVNVGVYDVELTVATADGCSNSLVQQVEIHAIPVAGFSFGNLCLGEDFELTDESSPSSSITSWVWDFGNGDMANVQNPMYQYSSEGQYQIKLTVTTGNNCADSITQSVSVYPNPSADFSWIAACLNNPYVFTDASFSLGSSISQWEWNYGDNSGVSNQQNPTYTYASSGLFNVELIATTPNGCKDTVTHTIEVFDLPVADFSFTNACELDSILFDNLSVAPSGLIDSWQWNFGDGTSSLDTAPSHLYQTYGIYPVQLAVQSNEGCTDTATSNVEIYPLPTVSFEANITQGCQPLMVNYQENVTLPAPHTISQYQWNFGNGVEANVQQPPAISYSDSTLAGFDVHQFTVSLQVVTDNGCVTSDTMESYIIIFPNPVADFITTSDTAQVSTTTFNFIDESSENVYNWYWEFGDGETATEQNQTHTYPYLQTSTEFDVVLTVETRNGCTDTAMATVLADNEFTFYIPNTLTPNGDGINDFFTPKGTGFETYTTSIFTRWGEEIFYSEDPEHRWDGTYKGALVEQGVFVYRIELKHFSNRVNAYVGNVNVLR
jgi:gliding motility-associated-like protein